MRHNAGFTFTELMVVIGIFAILSAIAVPNFLSWRTDAKLRGAVSNLKADLNLARLSAAREGQALAVTFETGLYQIFFDNGSGSGTADNWLPDGDEKMVRNRRLPAGITLTNDVGGQLEFDARGLLPGGGANLTLTDTSGQNVTLSLNRLGVITD
jgi:type IV fimbrial biogenesis protein FimT